MNQVIATEFGWRSATRIGNIQDMKSSDDIYMYRHEWLHEKGADCDWRDHCNRKWQENWHNLCQMNVNTLAVV